MLTTGEIAWILLISTCTMFMLLRVPTELVFTVERLVPFEMSKWLVAFVFLADPLMKLVANKKRGRDQLLRYMRAWFVFDAVAAAASVPIILGDKSWIVMIVLVKIAPVFHSLSLLRNQLVRGGNFLRFVQFAYLLTIAIHLVSCGWVYIRNSSVAAPATEYLHALYWAVTTMCTVGYGDITPQTDSEMLYATTVMLLGYVFFAYLIGNIASLFNSTDPLRAEHARTIDQATSFMQFHNVPASIQHRIVDYLGYMWERKVTYDETSMLNLLPWGLRSEISMYLRREVIERVPFFREASDSLMREIADSLRPVVVTPGEFVFRIGDRARYMYFINAGSVEVLDLDGSTIGTLDEGDFFGEMALLEGRRRNASVRSLEYTDLYVLDSTHFKRILENFPEFREVVERVSADRAATLSDLRRSVQ